MNELSENYKKEYAELPAYESLSPRRLTWEEALQKTVSNNLEYRELQRQYENSEYRKGKTLRSLIPLIDAGYYYSAPLRWGEGDPVNRSFNINIFFNFPQLIQLPIESYTNALAVMKADTDLRLKRREIEAQLYQAFREYELLLREEHLGKECNDEATKSKTEEINEKKRLQWSALCKLMNDYSARWEPVCQGLPRIRLKDYRKRAQAPDKLFLASIALRAEAARLQRLGVFVRFLPTAQLYFYSPSLFTSSGGTMDGFMRNADDVRINLNSYVSIDTKLEQYHNYKDAKKGEELTKALIVQTMREHKNKIESVLRSWDKYEEWKLGIRDYVNFRNTQALSGVDDAIERHQESLEIENQLISQERSNLERECAAMQEYGWRTEAEERALFAPKADSEDSATKD